MPNPRDVDCPALCGSAWWRHLRYIEFIHLYRFSNDMLYIVFHFDVLRCFKIVITIECYLCVGK